MDVVKLVSQMTLEEKAGLCSGLDFWHTKPVERLGVPSVMMCDGPHGLRKQMDADEADHLGVNDSIKAVCFPAGCATAASFDRELLTTLGEAIGDACQHEKVSVILGPAVNIKRSPLCGRNFEYFSEDPYLAGEIAAAHIHGVQSRNVGTSIKHFAANNQEHRRMSSDSVVDERTLREIYLAAFEKPIRDEKPWTVMCSYNRINGAFSAENNWLINDLLRGEWDFDGYVVTDWGAVVDRVKGLMSGIDLEMPASGGQNDKQIVEAVKSGKLDENVLDTACVNLLNICYRYLENAKPDTAWDMEAQHELAAKLAAECMVLLKNDDDILPLCKNDDVAFIGEFAEKPRFQGGGSSHINCFKVESALEAAKGMKYRYVRGFDIENDTASCEMIKEAVDAAKAAKVAVVFAGLPDAYESEGYDRTHMRLPDCQNKLISAVAAVNPNTVVVLHNGSPVEMPWVDDVKGILEAYLGGQAVGKAIINILYGDANPCGKLPETFPIKLEDNPSYLFFGGEKNVTEYREGVFVGYRYYDKKRMDVLFPFGYGLSYTTFEYSNLHVSSECITDNDTLEVTVDVKNTGKVFGKEIVELYVADKESTPIRPVRELRGFEKVALMPGETKTVSFTLNKRAFAYWNTEIHDWHVESGEFDVMIGRSSRHIALKKTISVNSTVELPVHYDMNSIFMDILADAKAKRVMEPYLDMVMGGISHDNNDESDVAQEAITTDMAEAMLKYMPIRAALSFGEGDTTPEMLQMLCDQMNKRE